MATFSKTQDLIPFMKENGVSSIRVAKFDKTGKFGFITDKDLSGRVSNQVREISKDNAHELAVSWFAPEDGEPSWMVHPRGEGGLEIISSFSI